MADRKAFPTQEDIIGYVEELLDDEIYGHLYDPYGDLDTRELAEKIYKLLRSYL